MRTDEIRQAADIVAGMAGEFTDLARSISGDGSLEPSRILHRLLSVAASAVPGSEHAGITLITGNGRPRTGAASDDLPAQVDRIQYQTGEGPCLQAAVTRNVVLANDLSSAPQWPAFASRAVADTGVRSVLCYRLFLTEENHGALNFYALKPDAFDESSVGHRSNLRCLHLDGPVGGPAPRQGDPSEPGTGVQSRDRGGDGHPDGEQAPHPERGVHPAARRQPGPAPQIAGDRRGCHLHRHPAGAAGLISGQERPAP
jgi:hypothetical protein